MVCRNYVARMRMDQQEVREQSVRQPGAARCTDERQVPRSTWHARIECWNNPVGWARLFDPQAAMVLFLPCTTRLTNASKSSTPSNMFASGPSGLNVISI